MAAKNRGLGRGLNALLGDASAIEQNQSTQSLPVEFLQRGEYQPRKEMDVESLQELADSISAQGVMQPIMVRSVGTDKYEIIAGERRWRAAQLAGLHEIPVIIRDISDQTAMALALIENIQREDLNPLEEAEGLSRLLKEFEMTHQQVADAVGKSRATVTNLLRLIDLQSEVKALLQKGSIDMGHARALLGLQNEEQITAANKITAAGLTVRATEALVKNMQTAKPVSQTVIDPDIERLQIQIAEQLGSPVTIKHKKNGQGKLVVKYSSLEELEGVLERIQIKKT